MFKRSTINLLTEGIQGATLLAAIFWLVFWEADPLQSTIDGEWLFSKAFLGGFLAAFLPSLIVGRRFHDHLAGMNGPLKRVLVFSAFNGLLAGLLVAAICSYANRTQLAGPVGVERGVIVSKHKSRRSFEMRIVLVESARSIALPISKERYDSIESMDQVGLTLQEGVLGFVRITSVSY